MVKGSSGEPGRQGFKKGTIGKGERLQDEGGAEEDLTLGAGGKWSCKEESGGIKTRALLSGALRGGTWSSLH